MCTKPLHLMMISLTQMTAPNVSIYRIARNFGGGKLWRILEIRQI